MYQTLQNRDALKLLGINKKFSILLHSRIRKILRQTFITRIHFQPRQLNLRSI
jgi:hypothetical protein